MLMECTSPRSTAFIIRWSVPPSSTSPITCAENIDIGSCRDYRASALMGTDHGHEFSSVQGHQLYGKS